MYLLCSLKREVGKAHTPAYSLTRFLCDRPVWPHIRRPMTKQACTGLIMRCEKNATLLESTVQKPKKDGPGVTVDFPSRHPALRLASHQPARGTPSSRGTRQNADLPRAHPSPSRQRPYGTSNPSGTMRDVSGRSLSRVQWRRRTFSRVVIFFPEDKAADICSSDWRGFRRIGGFGLFLGDAVEGTTWG